MIELTWAQIRDAELGTTLAGLARQKVPYATALKILTILKSIEEEQKKLASMATIIRDKYLTQDPETKEWTPKEGMTEELKAAEKDFLETKCRLKTPKIRGEELTETKLSAVELFKLEAFMDLGEDKGPTHLRPVEGNA